MLPLRNTSPPSPPGRGSPNISTNCSNEFTWVGFNAGPFSNRPMIAGPTSPGKRGNWELSISLIKIPGEINLNLREDIKEFSLNVF